MTKMIDASEGIGAVKLGVSWKKPFFIDCYKGFRTLTYYPDDIESVREIDEDTYRSAGGAAAWAITGGILTGGIGLIAGAAFGGRRRSNSIYLVRFKDGNFVAFEEKNGQPLKRLKAFILTKEIASS